jgi:Putative lumazine-binding
MAMKAHDEILQVISTYFKGVYEGDAGTLRDIFHRRAQLFGEVNGHGRQKSIADYLEHVESRKSPADQGEPFLMRALSIDVAGSIAMAKLKYPISGLNYIEFLTLARIQGKWLIVARTLTHVDDSAI